MFSPYVYLHPWASYHLTMECPVCCETVTKAVNCGFCEYKACHSCVKSFILDRPDIPSCMSCKNEWNDDHIRQNFTKKFFNTEYRDHLKNFLFNKERARFPEAQAEIAWDNEVKMLREEVDTHRLMVHMKSIQLNDLLRNEQFRTTEHAATFKHMCADPECRGLVSSAWKCGVCDKKTCKDCRVLVGGDDHVCDEDTKKTVEMLKKDTRPCPKCAVPIHKIEGCDQMWCTECNTAFSWKKGSIITGNIHNPHFFEAQRATRGHVNRAPGDIPCGGLPTYDELHGAGYDCTSHEFPANMIRVVCYLEGMIHDNPPPTNMVARKKFLRSDVTEEHMKKTIVTAHRKYSFARERSDVYRMLSTTITDILRQLVTKDITHREAYEVTSGLLKYGNTAIAQIMDKYGSKHNGLMLRCYRDDGTGRFMIIGGSMGIIEI